MSAVPHLATTPARLGFVGLGWIGRQRLDSLASQTGVDVVALCDSQPSKLDDAARAYPNAKCTHHLDELLDAGVDGVVIATPNGAHAAQALHCLHRGAAVFCQKPLATTARDVHQIIAAARAADRLLGIDFSYRHVHGMAELKRRLRDGALGEITSLELTFHNAYGPDKQWCFDPASAGGGCLLDLGVHLLDLALWLQDMPRLELVNATRFTCGQHTQPDEIEDQAYVELRQANGAVVRIACSWYAQIGCDAVIGMRILGTQGGAHWRNLNGSFYDFEMLACHGAQAETLAHGADAWGPRALAAWSERLARDRRFDREAEEIARSAELIDAVYAA